MEKTYEDVLAKFGQELIEACFDIPFYNFKFFENYDAKVTEDRFYNMKYYKELMANDLEVYSIAHQAIMTSVMTQLLDFLDNNEDFRVMYTDPENNKPIDLLSLSVGRGEVFGKEGWIMKYSKYPDMLKEDLYDPK